MNWDYIAGFFDGDGSLSIYNPIKYKFGHAINISLHQKDKKILKTIKRFLIEKGCKCNIYTRDYPREIKITNKNYINSTMSQLTISSKNNALIFCNGVKDKVIVKKDKINNALKEVENWRSIKRYTKEEIKSILNLWDKGKYPKQISEIIKQDPRKICFIIKKYRNDSSRKRKERNIKTKKRFKEGYKMMSDFSLKGKGTKGVAGYKGSIFTDEIIEQLRMAIVEIIKAETFPYELIKPDKKELELKSLRDKLCKRLNVAFGKDCRYCECGGEIRESKHMFGDEEKRKKMMKKFKKEFGRDLPKIDNENCINCGQMYTKNGKKLSYKLGWL